MDDRQLNEWLRELARLDAGIEPPSSLERRTLAAFNDWQATANVVPASRRRWIPPTWSTRDRTPWTLGTKTAAALSVAAAIVAVVALSQRPGDGRDVGTMSRSPVVTRQMLALPGPSISADPAPTAGQVEATVPPGSVQLARERRARATRPAGRRAPPAPRVADTVRFTRLGPDMPHMGADRFEPFHLSRVQVPRRVLLDLGIDLGVLAEGRQGDETIDADVMFGEDGRAKAIRLTPAARRIP